MGTQTIFPIFSCGLGRGNHNVNVYYHLAKTAPDKFLAIIYKPI